MLTFFAPRLVADHGYPARQCVDMPMMLTSPRLGGEPDTAAGLAAAWSGRSGCDFLYASNVSQPASGLLATAVERAGPGLRGWVEVAGSRMLAFYAGGGSLATEPDIDGFLEALVAEGALAEHGADARRGLRDALWNPLNTGLYRQQALGWVVDLAEARGLTLKVHGAGWEAHPRFGGFAAGSLDHAGLQAATAEARFALHLEPYICFTHHRMLDALRAGTPVLVRSHPGDFGLQRVAAFLWDHAREAETDAAVRAAFLAAGDEANLSAYASLTSALRGVTWDLAGDVCAQVRAWQRAGVLPDVTGQAAAMPGLEAVGFSDAAGLAARWSALSVDASAVGAVLLEQRAAVEARLTFDAALSQVLEKVGGLLGELA